MAPAIATKANAAESAATEPWTEWSSTTAAFAEATRAHAFAKDSSGLLDHVDGNKALIFQLQRRILKLARSESLFLEKNSFLGIKNFQFLIVVDFNFSGCGGNIDAANELVGQRPFRG